MKLLLLIGLLLNILSISSINYAIHSSIDNLSLYEKPALVGVVSIIAGTLCSGVYYTI